MASLPSKLIITQFVEAVGEVVMVQRLTTQPCFFAPAFEPLCAHFFISLQLLPTCSPW